MTTTRRHFLRTSGLAGAAIGFPTIIPARVLGADAPSKKINILQIGCGRIGRDMDMPGILRQSAARIVAVCDLDSLRVADAKQMVEGYYKKNKVDLTVATYGDYRKALEHPDIDAVAVSTPDHWHAEPVIAAALAGKDIYVQKPLSMTLKEGRAVNPLFPRLRSGQPLFQRPSPQKQIPSNTSQWNADADGDGQTNLWEYAFATNPRSASSVTRCESRFSTVGENTFLEYRVPRDARRSVSITGSVSGNLSSWSTSAPACVVAEDQPTHLLFQSTVPVDESPRQFMRAGIAVP